MLSLSLPSRLQKALVGMMMDLGTRRLELAKKAKAKHDLSLHRKLKDLDIRQEAAAAAADTRFDGSSTAYATTASSARTGRSLFQHSPSPGTTFAHTEDLAEAGWFSSARCRYCISVTRAAGCLIGGSVASAATMDPDSDRVVKLEETDIEEEIYTVLVEKRRKEEECRKQEAKKPFRPVRATISALLRLFVWYSVFTALFYCPSSVSELDDQSPRVCRPYLVVRTHLEPHLAPYYRKYGAPYVEKLEPYAHSFHEKVYTPTAQFSKDVYHGYAALHVQRGAQLAKEQWTQRVSPHIDPLQKQITGYYGASVEPHVKSAQSIIVPQVRVAVAQSVLVKDKYLIPYYIRTRPVVQRAYATVHNLVVSTIAPYTQRAGSAIFLFLNGTVRTHITHLYSENVEPQLVKIGAKLASYREGRTIQHVNLETASITVEVPISATEPETREHVESKATQTSSSVELPTTTELTPAQQTEQAREKIATDLRTWKERSAASAEKGRENVQEKVHQIVESIYNRQRPVGEALLSSLQGVVERELHGLKSELYDIVQSIPAEYTPEDELGAQDEFLQALKLSSLAIRERAHDLRLWFNEYMDTLTESINKTVNNTLDVLDNVRNLSLQEIGMRWSQMDGVTYNDWANFYDLKTKLVEWKDDIRQAGMQHNTFLAAKEFADSIVAAGMDAARNAAQQLSELKAIGKLKIEAGETSENLDVSHINEEMIQERRKSMKTSSPPTPLKTTDLSDSPTPSDTEVVQSASEPSAPTSSVAESPGEEVEAPLVDNNGEQPKAAFFDAEPTPSADAPAIEPTPEVPALEETPATGTPSESAPNTTSIAAIIPPLASGIPGSDLSDATTSDSDKVIDYIYKEQVQLEAADEQRKATVPAHEDSSSIPSLILASSTASAIPSLVTQKIEDAILGVSDDSISSSTLENILEPAPLTPLTEALGVDEIIDSATDELSSVIDSAKAGLEGESPIPSEKVNSLIGDASMKLDEVLPSAQSSISSLEEIPVASPSQSAGDKQQESIDNEIARLTAALQAAQARLLELTQAGSSTTDTPEHKTESESTIPEPPSASSHADEI
ncbi:uncharacterized protein GIQ15_05788 [Arthroderma uncinatum]|uniref:uncharacterized protein n=1 Tax=Arthroderma uncinatum TaxID=74035 RepID=UPI00144AB990|nr:uncharacterized protein GIQ15_05788 [Arthroderma uncinatum]KAF3480441.1 hypothetical protein GIQ15_05788 [Arthroderma uncinatum]